MPTIGAVKRRILAICMISLTVLLVQQVNSQIEPKKSGEAQAKKAVVILTIDYGDGAQKRFPSIPWQRRMTVLDALEWAAKHPRGIDFFGKGNGSTKLISKIDDLQNSGAAGKNWVFRVNDKLGDRSCGIFAIQADDRILWKFERYQ